MVQGGLFEHELPEMEPGATWFELAAQAVYRVALRHVTFTSNEVWAAMPVSTPINKRRAMGVVINRARQAGWIEDSGQYAKAGSNGRPIPIYRSRVIATRSADAQASA